MILIFKTRSKMTFNVWQIIKEILQMHTTVQQLKMTV